MYGLIPQPRRPSLRAPFTMDPVQGLPTSYQPRPIGGPMHYPLMPYESRYGQTGTDLERAQTELELLAIEAEEIARGAGAEVSSAVQATRRYAQHRQFLYMVGAPAVVVAGLTNRRYPILGLFAALVGAYVGMKNYQEHQEGGGAVYGSALEESHRLRW